MCWHPIAAQLRFQSLLGPLPSSFRLYGSGIRRIAVLMSEGVRVKSSGATSPGRAGNPESWVDEHGDALFRYALLRTRDRSSAEDLVQETFLAALKSRSEFKGQSELRTWLIGILRHKIVDHLRKRPGSPLPGPSDDSDPLIDGGFGPNGRWVRPPAAFEIDPALLAENQEFWDVLRNCIEGMPGRAGEAFSMRMISDMPAEEVCKVLSVTSTNLWVLLHRARARLRTCLEMNWFGRGTKERS